MIPAHRLVAAVCMAIRGLREPKGTTVKNITAYVRKFVDGKPVAVTNVRKAIKTALDRQYLKETRDGKYKLNVVGMSAKAIKLIDKLTEGNMVIETKCIPTRKRSKSRGERRTKRSKCGSRRKRSKSRRSKCGKRGRRNKSRSRISRRRTKSRRSRREEGGIKRRRHHRSSRRKSREGRRHRRRSSQRRGRSHRRSRSKRSRSRGSECRSRSRSRHSRSRRRYIAFLLIFNRCDVRLHIIVTYVF